MAAATAAFRASRVDMLQAGVPSDYVDALLDDQYMEELIESTNRRMNKRAEKMKKYILLQKLIFWFLVAQALLGVWVAFYKTCLQPDKLFGSRGKLQNADLVLMLDASKPMRHIIGQQHKTAIDFSGKMKKAMADHKAAKEKEMEEIVLKKQEEAGGGLLPFLSRFGPKPPRGWATVSGAELRVATGVFNAGNARLLHPFMSDFEDAQESELKGLEADDYESIAFWHKALKECKDRIKDMDEKIGKKPNTKRYCAILGDDSAMCTRVEVQAVDEHCKQWPGLCPTDDDKVTLGDTFLEYSSELDTCSNFVKEELKESAEAIMMFTVGSEDEGQLRVGNPSFQRFVKDTTGCEIKKDVKSETGADGVTSVQETYVYNGTGCERFIMGSTMQEVSNKSDAIAKLLKGDIKVQELLNPEKDNRFLWFLLLPLNLLFYLIWSRILRCTSAVRLKAERAMGKKKKVVKVTKLLVEKPEPDSAAQQRREQFSEVELAEMASLQPLFELGAPMMLRARLKGGYLRADQGAPDGNGHAADPTSNWIFEKVEETEEQAAEEAGCRVRVRNCRGELLIADEQGVRFAPLPSSGDLEKQDDIAAAGAAAEFLLEQPSSKEGEAYRLGETMQLKACGTGQYLRVQKDGSCNATGDASEHETQFVIDRGGPIVQSGSVVTLSSNVTGAFMKGTPDGTVSATPGHEEWRFWKLEKVASAQDASSSSMGGEEHAHHAPLKEGDIITLRGFNQHNLEVDEKQGKVTCGSLRMGEEKPPEPLDTIQEFVIERVGMGLVRKHDQTLRAGMQVCLKPVQKRSGRASSSSVPEGGIADDAAVKEGSGNMSNADYLRVNGDGSLSADGKVTQREISLVLDLAKVHDMVVPLHGTLQKGDVDLLVSPLWNKGDVKKLNAMTANWTKDQDLDQFKGPVVVASDKGTYVVPKARGVDSGWVAVVNEGVDIPKAARQAKLQGATGLIVRCEDVLSLKKMRKAKDAASTPDLPTVFVDNAVGEALDERGIVLNGCEFRRHYVTDAMRALGSVSHGHDAFQALGTGLLQRNKERLEEVVEEVVPQEVVEEDNSNFKWKVQSNTHYLWGKSGGGAAVMRVNFGTAAPPSAVTHTKQTADASQKRVMRQSIRTSVAGVAVLEADDIKSKRLASELNVLASEEVRVSQPLEQLSEESDFKIEYQFEEMEIAKGEQLDDVEEQEIMEEQEAVIAKFGVPQKLFWLVAIGLLSSTTLLIGILSYYVFGKEPEIPDEGKWGEEEFQPGTEALFALHRNISFVF